MCLLILILLVGPGAVSPFADVSCAGAMETCRLAGFVVCVAEMAGLSLVRVLRGWCGHGSWTLAAATARRKLCGSGTNGKISRSRRRR